MITVTRKEGFNSADGFNNVFGIFEKSDKQKESRDACGNKPLFRGKKRDEWNRCIANREKDQNKAAADAAAAAASNAAAAQKLAEAEAVKSERAIGPLGWIGIILGTGIVLTVGTLAVIKAVKH